MKYTIRGKGIAITEAMQERIINVLSKLEKFDQVIDTGSNAQIEVKYYKENLAQITVFIEHAKMKHILLKSDVRDPDFYKALDKSQKELRQQIIKFKERLVDKKQKSPKFSKATIMNQDDFEEDN